ncbi:MAG: alpha/beta fold hydrolase [Microbacterium gubbeenense]|uniref:alpha/beta fold hydrolase n=1 Tax=Microbacterium gubbeenense TaxID=159896 RepID=UPI003F9C6C42
MTTHADLNEFSFLADDARDQGAEAPAAARVQLELPDGRALSAIRYGSGTPNAVFLHGAGLNAHTWDRTVIDLGAPALSLDLPGHGDSSWRTDADYAPETIVPDIIRAIEEWASAPITLVGQSLGGLTAAHVASARPDLVSDLILVDIVPGIGSGGPSQLSAFYARLEFESVDDVLDHALAFGLGGSRDKALRGVLLNTRTREDGVVEWKHHLAHVLSEKTEVPRLRDHHDTDWDALRRVAQPITLIAGSRGYLGDDDLAAFAAAQPEARIVTVDATHNVQETAHRDIADLVRSTRPERT